MNLDDFEDYWYDVDRRWEQKDHFLSCLDDSNCPCPVCCAFDSHCFVPETEREWATEQMNRWLSRFS